MFKVYKPKGDRVKAVQVRADNVVDTAKLLNGRLVQGGGPNGVVAGFEYPTFEGVKSVKVGDWVIQTSEGAYRMMEEEAFTAQYELAYTTATRSS